MISRVLLKPSPFPTRTTRVFQPLSPTVVSSRSLNSQYIVPPPPNSSNNRSSQSSNNHLQNKAHELNVKHPQERPDPIGQNQKEDAERKATKEEADPSPSPALGGMASAIVEGVKKTAEYVKGLKDKVTGEDNEIKEAPTSPSQKAKRTPFPDQPHGDVNIKTDSQKRSMSSNPKQSTSTGQNNTVPPSPPSTSSVSNDKLRSKDSPTTATTGKTNHPLTDATQAPDWDNKEQRKDYEKVGDQTGEKMAKARQGQEEFRK